MSTTVSTAMLSKAKRPIKINDELNPKFSNKGSSFVREMLINLMDINSVHFDITTGNLL